MVIPLCPIKCLGPKSSTRLSSTSASSTMSLISRISTIVTTMRTTTSLLITTSFSKTSISTFQVLGIIIDRNNFNS
jgi:hypothetical protein